MASINDINDINNSFHQQREAGSAALQPVELPPPEDWVPGRNLFPSHVMAGFHADYEKYNADTWAKYVLEKAKEYNAASCASWSGELFFTRTD